MHFTTMHFTTTRDDVGGIQSTIADPPLRAKRESIPPERFSFDRYSTSAMKDCSGDEHRESFGSSGDDSYEEPNAKKTR